MSYTIPPSLKKDSTIGLIAPSSPLRPERLELGVAYLKKKGFHVKIGKHLLSGERFLAGKDEERAEDIMDFFRDEEVDAIMATAGGYGSQRLLPHLDYDIIRQNPKILTGFSDTTALQLGLLKKADLCTYTGFVFRDLDNDPPNHLIDETLEACLTGKSYAVTEGVSVYAGNVEGPLIGGNLSLLTALIGTPYLPKLEGCILLIEEVFAEPFMVDCMISQLHLAGIFQHISGLIFGQFELCNAIDSPKRDGTIDDVITEWAARVTVPCIKDFPYGHGERRAVLPIGQHVKLNADTCTLNFL